MVVGRDQHDRPAPHAQLAFEDVQDFSQRGSLITGCDRQQPADPVERLQFMCVAPFSRDNMVTLCHVKCSLT
jgi:hypothetical protein